MENIKKKKKKSATAACDVFQHACFLKMQFNTSSQLKDKGNNNNNSGVDMSFLHRSALLNNTQIIVRRHGLLFPLLSSERRTCAAPLKVCSVQTCLCATQSVHLFLLLLFRLTMQMCCCLVLNLERAICAYQKDTISIK